MTGWTPRVFWKTVGTAPTGGGVALTLDGRVARTPGKAPLVLPTQGFADLVAAEWAAQTDRIRPDTMPASRMAHSAIDTLGTHHATVAQNLSAYGASDLLCYRAEGPGALVARQAAGWDPLLDWAAGALGARLRVGTGIIHVPQDPAALARLSAQVAALSPFRLAAFHDLVALSGSLILAFAVAHRARDAEQAWDLSRIDEDWQADLWGRDAEAEAVAARKRGDFLFAARLFHLADDGARP